MNTIIINTNDGKFIKLHHKLLPHFSVIHSLQEDLDATPLKLDTSYDILHYSIKLTSKLVHSRFKFTDVPLDLLIQLIKFCDYIGNDILLYKMIEIYNNYYIHYLLDNIYIQNASRTG